MNRLRLFSACREQNGITDHPSQKTTGKGTQRNKRLKQERVQDPGDPRGLLSQENKLFVSGGGRMKGYFDVAGES